VRSRYSIHSQEYNLRRYHCIEYAIDEARNAVFRFDARSVAGNNRFATHGRQTRVAELKAVKIAITIPMEIITHYIGVCSRVFRS